MGDAAMHQAQAFAYDWIASPRQPTLLLFRQSGNVTPQGINEQGLG
jgi:hypothetical protein